ncbi:MAG: hypothetical protein U9Q27_01240 [Patescibacteria group bacterium]|nr:hypothetical protein [Patescibacteria group bacterium]
MDFFQQKQKQKYMVVILVIVILITVVVLFSDDLFKKNNKEYVFTATGTKEINIDWDVLQDPRLKELRIFR